MLDEQYKELINSYEVQPPADAWAFINKAINKPWYVNPWGKVALFSSAVIISFTIVYFVTERQRVKPAGQITTVTSENKAALTTQENGNVENNQNSNSNAHQQDESVSANEVNKKPESGGTASKKESGVNTKTTIDAVKKDNPDPSTASNTKPNKANGSGSSSQASVNNMSAPSLKLSTDEICIGKVVTVKVSPGNSNAVLDFGDNHQVNLAAGKNVVFPYTYLLPGIYTISVRANNSVLASEDIMVDEKVQAYYKTSVTENTSIQFNNLSIAATKFIWFFDDGKMETMPDKRHATHYYSSTSRKVFNVKLVALNTKTGCSDTFESAVNNPNYKNYFFTVINNVFTPNNDGLNDVFEIPATELKEWHIIILDETGHLVFETDKQSNYWNGRINNLGNECPKGMYRYIIKYKQPDDTEMNQKAGYITLIRE